MRVDILERLADLIRPALAWKENSPGAEARRRVRRPRLCGDAGDDLADGLGRRGLCLDPARARLSHGPPSAARREAGGEGGDGVRRKRRRWKRPRRKCPAIRSPSAALLPELNFGTAANDNAPVAPAAGRSRGARRCARGGSRSRKMRLPWKRPWNRLPRKRAEACHWKLLRSRCLRSALKLRLRKHGCAAPRKLRRAATKHLPLLPRRSRRRARDGRSLAPRRPSRRAPPASRARRPPSPPRSAQAGRWRAACGRRCRRAAGAEGEKPGEHRSRRNRHRDFRKPREGGEGAPREGKPDDKREDRGGRRDRPESKGKDERRDKFKGGGDRGGRDRDKGGRRDRESGPSHRQYASSANPRDNRAADPNSPFAKLAALKEQLARKD